MNWESTELQSPATRVAQKENFAIRQLKCMIAQLKSMDGIVPPQRQQMIAIAVNHAIDTIKMKQVERRKVKGK